MLERLPQGLDPVRAAGSGFGYSDYARIARFSRRRSRRGAREKGSGPRGLRPGRVRQPASTRAAKGLAVTGHSTRAPLRPTCRRRVRSYSSKEGPRWRHSPATAGSNATGAAAPATARGSRCAATGKMLKQPEPGGRWRFTVLRLQDVARDPAWRSETASAASAGVTRTTREARRRSAYDVT